MSEYLIQNSTLTSIADAIRSRTKSTDNLTLDNMATAVVAMNLGSDTLGDYLNGNLSEYSNGTMTGIPSYAFYSNSTLTSVSFPVCNSIGNNAFYNCTNLTDISFPNCSTIGNYAFYSCGMVSASFAKCTSITNSAFAYCKSLVTADFSSCTNVGAGIFYGCNQLENVNFPKLTSTASNMFAYCSNLKSINLPACTDVTSYTFRYCTGLSQGIELPACTTIHSSAFYGCSTVTSVSLPECTIVNSSAFQNCYSLSNVYVPKCSYVGSQAFYGCSDLTNIDLPLCSTIHQSAFKNCTSLTYANFNKVGYLYSHTFENCTSLMSIDAPECTFVDMNCIMYCTNLQYINFPKVTHINPANFVWGNNIVDANMPMNDCIQGNMFTYCSNLISVNMQMAKQIGYNAFHGCINLPRVNLLICSSIGSSAFYGCTNLSTVVLSSTAVCTLSNSNAFSLTPIADGTGYVYVPSSLVTSYKTSTNWSYYAHSILPLNDVNYCNQSSKHFPLNYTVNVSVPIILANEDVIPTFTVVSSDESLVSVSNLSANNEYVTFDATTYDLNGSTDIIISTTYNENEFTTTINAVVSNICGIGDISTNGSWMLFNETKNISSVLKYMNDTPEVIVTSSDNTIASISNIVVTSECIDFDVITASTEGTVEITITAIYNGQTYVKTFNLDVYEASPMPTYTVTKVGSYGFNKVNGIEIYGNANALKSTYALCKVNISAPRDCKMYIDYYQDATSGHIGLISKLDTDFASSTTVDSTSTQMYYYKSHISNRGCLTYDIPAGEHYICVKFISSSNYACYANDLQFAIRFEYVD